MESLLVSPISKALAQHGYEGFGRWIPRRIAEVEG